MTAAVETYVIAPLPLAAAAALASDVVAVHAAASQRSWAEAGVARLLQAPASFGFLARDTVGKPTGFVLLQYARDEAEILMIAVIPEARRTGIATRLLCDAHEAAELLGVTRVFLEVAADNTPALALYHRQQYLPVGRRKNYYPATDGDAAGARDAVLLARVLGTNTAAVEPSDGIDDSGFDAS